MVDGEDFNSFNQSNDPLVVLGGSSIPEIRLNGHYQGTTALTDVSDNSVDNKPFNP